MMLIITYLPWGLTRQDGYMIYTRGDKVRFKLESGEVHDGNIQFIEKNKNEEIYYINSSSRWAYKILGEKIIS